MNENLLISNTSENNNVDTHSNNITSNDLDKKNNNVNISTVCYKLIIGELVAILNVGAGELKNKISHQRRQYSIILNFMYYLFFGIFWILFNHGINKPKFYFFLITFFDTQANFFKFLSLAKCDPSYLYIINTLSILFRVILTYIFVSKSKYSWKHFLALFLGFIGTLLIFFGVLNYKTIIEEIKNNYVDFLFGFISAICFTITIILMDYNFIKGKDIFEFFPYLGLGGSILIFTEGIAFFIINNIEISFNFNIEMIEIIYVIGFVIIAFIVGTIIPFYIKKFSASMLNFFIVSQIFWNFIFILVFEKENNVTFFFYIGCGIIMIGTVIFAVVNFKEKHKSRKSSLRTGSRNNNISNNNISNNNISNNNTSNNNISYNNISMGNNASLLTISERPTNFSFE